MSTNSSGSLGRRIARRGPQSRASTNKLPHVDRYDAYSYALRAAYLHHLLQPKLRRLQHVPNPPAQVTRQTSSVTDLVRESLVVRDPKSTKFPSAFMSQLDKRLTDVLYGKERMQEYSDPAVKRTFAIFFNEFKEPKFRKGVEKDRKMEDLLLIFFSTATKELIKTKKSPEDDSWKLMVDRHVALFVRFISAILKDNDWAKDKPELASRLQTLENKLLMHDQDLAAASQRNGGAGGMTVEADIPRSQFVKDMPMVPTVAAMFGKELSQAQSDIDAQKDLWTEQSALRDLKMYQTSLSINRGTSTLRNNDFDTDAAYDNWRSNENRELAQMITIIVKSNVELAKTTGNSYAQTKPRNGSINGNGVIPSSRRSTESQNSSFDQSADRSNHLNNGDSRPNSPTVDLENIEPYMFIPPDPRMYYRAVVKEAMVYKMKSETNQERFLSKATLELLKELGARWRVPLITRLTMLRDVVRELLNDQAIDLDTFDAAFSYTKEPELECKDVDLPRLLDHREFPIADFVQNQRILTSIHETLLRDLFEQLQQCFSAKPPEFAPIMTILEEHIYADPLFPKSTKDLDSFSEHLREILHQKARETYETLTQQHLSNGTEVEFYHIIQLGKAVFKQAERIQKRYRKVPEIMGVKPAPIFIQVVLPAFATDAKDQITSVLEQAKARGEEIPMEDGFELYREMSEIRQIHNDVLPNIEFAFHVETLLAPFVWRWIATTDESIVGWVEAAIRQDNFKVRAEDLGEPPSEDEKHSVSVIDIFRSFNEAVQQIVSLNWNDELQYAKFMTALSKSISTGLTRYCEQLEKFFTAEMDRLTPEQEAELKQTKQEKWIRIARDAITTKEKMEPFQFFAESFVKLNDIEWAMLQLDRLEREINVDACAEVIQRKDPPQKPTQRKAEKFVFTVKIIEAEDLKACDINGLSDPYVVLGDEYQKRLAKTRIIHGNLNPRWEETVDITTQGPLNIIATIWDWDIMGDHDCVGRASIKLDPVHFKDFLPREYWLDLDTQGRLLVRISMEGEKDDIRFYFGRAFRTLKRTEREMTRKITDKLSAYIHECLSRRTLKSLTSKGITLSSVSNYFQRNRQSTPTQPVLAADIENALQPLFSYFNDNFAVMKITLTENSMITVMSRLWKETLSTLESLLVPPLSDKPSAQRQLSEQEFDIVFKWLQMLFDFFHAVDEDKVAKGVPLETLRSPKYQDLKNLNFFYYEPYDVLIKTSERMAVATMNRQREAQARANRLSAPGSLSPQPSFGGAAGVSGVLTMKRSKTVMQSRSLGTMKKAKEDKRREAQAEPSDDMIMRILRMRPEAEQYLRDRSRQRERLAAAATAEQIVRASMAQGAAREREIRREMALGQQRRQ